MINKDIIPIGKYLVMWCSKHGIKRTDFKKAVGYHNATCMTSIKGLSLQKYFIIAEYMAETSQVLPVEFYLKRLKNVLQGKYTQREYSKE